MGRAAAASRPGLVLRGPFSAREGMRKGGKSVGLGGRASAEEKRCLRLGEGWGMVTPSSSQDLNSGGL